MWEVRGQFSRPMDAVLEEFQNFLRACGYVIEYNQCLVLENME